MNWTQLDWTGTEQGHVKQSFSLYIVYVFSVLGTYKFIKTHDSLCFVRIFESLDRIRLHMKGAGLCEAGRHVETCPCRTNQRRASTEPGDNNKPQRYNTV